MVDALSSSSGASEAGEFRLFKPLNGNYRALMKSAT